MSHVPKAGGVRKRLRPIRVDLTLSAAAGPPATIAFLVATIPFGLALLIPSLAFLWKVFGKA